MPKKLTQEEFIARAKKIRGDVYDYSKTLYVNRRTKVCIICKLHGEFYQNPEHHILGKSCPKCATLTRQEKQRKPLSYWIPLFIEAHGNLYDYSKATERSHKRDKITIVCKEHGEFQQTPYNHAINKTGCPVCNASKGELEIKRVLDDLNVEYKRNKTFQDCKHIHVLPFDFYIPKTKTIIEYDGKQHHEPVEHFGGEEYFKIIQIRDKIKNDYCRLNNINLIRIQHKDYNKIETILIKSLCL